MQVVGIGQEPNSAVTGTAAWISSVCAILAKDSAYGPMLNDPFAIYFASAISKSAPGLLARYDDEATRRAFITEREAAFPGLVTVVAYRKPEMERLARHALAATGARQLVVMGVGCDTLSLRLARDGVRPAVYEIDRPAVIDFRARVFGEIPLDLNHVRGIGVNFDHQNFGDILIEKGYDPHARTVFFAEGLLAYVSPDGVDDIFRFVKERSGRGSRFVFSFTENRRADAPNRIQGSVTPPAEPALFDLPPGEAKGFVEARNLRLLTLITATDLQRKYPPRRAAPINVLPFMHLAVAES